MPKGSLPPPGLVSQVCGARGMDIMWMLWACALPYLQALMQRQISSPQTTLAPELIGKVLQQPQSHCLGWGTNWIRFANNKPDLQNARNVTCHLSYPQFSALFVPCWAGPISLRPYSCFLVLQISSRNETYSQPRPLGFSPTGLFPGPYPPKGSGIQPGELDQHISNISTAKPFFPSPVGGNNLNSWPLVFWDGVPHVFWTQYRNHGPESTRSLLV